MPCKLFCIGFAALICGLSSFAQTPAPHKKILTPEQKQYQQELARWNQQLKDIHAKGQSALDAELAREKRPLCPDSDNTRSQGICQDSEIDKTQANYEGFADAIRSTLELPCPAFPGSAPPGPGPTGVPLSSAQLVAEFDHNEAEWRKYHADQAKAAYDQYKSGTLAPVFEGEAHLRLIRLHMCELAFIYGWKLPADSSEYHQ